MSLYNPHWIYTKHLFANNSSIEENIESKKNNILLIAVAATHYVEMFS